MCVCVLIRICRHCNFLVLVSSIEYVFPHLDKDIFTFQKTI